MAPISEEENKRAMQNALEAAKADLQQAQWCLAACVGGSFATSNADAWADLDFHTVVAPNSYESVLARRYEIPRAWGDVIYEEGVPGTSPVRSQAQLGNPLWSRDLSREIS